MRKYYDEQKNQLAELYCNCCGKKIKTENGTIMELVFPAHVLWGYFSGKDGEHHQFDLCEDCYDKWVAAFQIPPETELENELL